MYAKERREAVEILRRFVKGEIEEEPLLGFVHSLDLRSIPHLFETLGLRNEDFRRIGFRDEDIARPLREYLDRGLSLEALRKRVRRISQIFTAAENQANASYRSDPADNLNLLALALDPMAPLSEAALSLHLAAVLEALEHRRPVPFRGVLGHILKELGSFHFTTLSLLEFSLSWKGRRLPWTDLGLLYGPPGRPDPRRDDVPEADLEPIWFIPLSVTTRRFYQEGLPACLGTEEKEDCAWMRPENCRVAGLREAYPWLPIDRFHPAYYIDPHGFAEILLDVEDLNRDCLRFAIGLFALQNGARSASLEGEEVRLLGGSGG